jgi:hypothetical protein
VSGILFSQCLECWFFSTSLDLATLACPDCGAPGAPIDEETEAHLRPYLARFEGHDADARSMQQSFLALTGTYVRRYFRAPRTARALQGTQRRVAEMDAEVERLRREGRAVRETMHLLGVSEATVKRSRARNRTK